MARPQVVLDTNVLVAGLRSRQGASFQLLSQVGQGRFEICVSVALVLEYEEVLVRERPALGLSSRDIDGLLDYLCSVARRQEIHFLWRPLLRDAGDDMVLELAVAGGCDAIITFNRRDFEGAELFGVRILTPPEFLQVIGDPG